MTRSSLGKEFSLISSNATLLPSACSGRQAIWDLTALSPTVPMNPLSWATSQKLHDQGL